MMKRLSVLLMVCVMAMTLFAGCGSKEENKNTSSDKEETVKENNDKTFEKETVNDNEENTVTNEGSDVKDDEKDDLPAKEDLIRCDTIQSAVVASCTNEEVRLKMIELRSGSFDLTADEEISIPEMSLLEMELKDVFGDHITAPKTEGFNKYHVTWEMDDKNHITVKVELKP